jgi:hypothetical protein
MAAEGVKADCGVEGAMTSERVDHCAFCSGIIGPATRVMPLSWYGDGPDDCKPICQECYEGRGLRDMPSKADDDPDYTDLRPIPEPNGEPC